MRTIETMIISKINLLCGMAENGKAYKLSKRDSVRVEDNKVIYSLWNTDLFTVELYTGKKQFFVSTNKYADDSGYRENWYSDYRENCPCSNTTKSRLNSLLWFYCKKTITQKNYVLYFDGAELPLNKWTEL